MRTSVILLDINDPKHREISAHRLIAKLPTIASYCYRHHRGLAVPAQKFQQSPVAAKALEVMMILHADHEQNASTSTVRLAGSSGANPFASIAAGVASLWGPAHGGANEAVINMLESIEHVTSKRQHSLMTTSKNAGSTRTSISTLASSCERWVFQ